ncbi:hypothetical protein [Streptomyces spiralis]|uniref:bacterial transcriptional activator domain-containing protein n=1 Tax=Streptomyces spiralis TaxID=66376 RepID=UPI0036AC7E1B
MTSTAALQQARRVLPALATTALLLASTAPAHATPPSPAVIDPRAPGLHLPAGHTLASARILHLTSPRRGLTQVITTHTTTPRPQPFKARPRPGPDRTPSAAASTTRPSPSASSSASPHSSATAGAAHAPTQPRTNPLPAATLLGVGTLLAALLLALWALARRLRRRRPDRRTTTSPAPAQELAGETSEPDALSRLDAALRSLARHCLHDGRQQPPRLRAAHITTRFLHVLPDHPGQQPPAPFTTADDGWWQLPATTELPASNQTRNEPAPYPGLFAIGTTHHENKGEEGVLLLDLTHLPALLLDGTPTHITEACTWLALEAATSPWADQIDITTIGFGHDLPHVLPRARITHQPDPAHALNDLSQQLLEDHQNPAAAPRPHLLLCPTPIGPDTARQYASLTVTTHTPLTLVAPRTTAAHFPTAPVLNASHPGPQPLDHLGIDITLHRLDQTAYQQITTALSPTPPPAHDTDQPQQTETPQQEAVEEHEAPAPPEAHSAHQPAAADTDTDGASPAPNPAGRDAGGDTAFPALLAALGQAPSLRLPSAASRHQRTHNTQPTTPHRHSHRGAPSPRRAPQQPPYDTPAQQPERTAYQGAPQIRVLGPLEVDGVDPTGHGPRIAQLAALIYFRPGRSADALCHDMDPHTPWTHATLNARYQGLRRALGNDPNGTPYVPRRTSGEDPYQLSPAIRCDWTTFQELTERALPQGPDGLPDLEQALALVRGRPFGDKPLPWAEPHQQEMTTHIIDIAHTIATHRTAPGPHHNLTAARHAIATGLEVDHTAELLYRDWLQIEAAAGNRPGLHTAASRLQHINSALGYDMEPETEQLIEDLLNNASSTQARNR